MSKMFNQFVKDIKDLDDKQLVEFWRANHNSKELTDMIAKAEKCQNWLDDKEIFAIKRWMYAGYLWSMHEFGQKVTPFEEWSK